MLLRDAHGLQVFLAGDLRYLLGALDPLLGHAGTATILNAVPIIAPVIVNLIII